MHQFIVPMKYQHKTRLGNWYEEWELEETKMKDYLKKHEENRLESEKTEHKLLHSLKKVSLTYSNDGYVHFDDQITFLNYKTKGLLACDIYDRIAGNDEAYSTTSSTLVGPCARTVFTIKKYESDTSYPDNIVHYGQQIRLMVNPRLLKKNFYLQSMPISNQNYAKFSRKQEVSVTSKDSFNSVWIVEYHDPKVRFEYNGQPVQCDQPVLLKHCFTAQWLASDHVQYRNDFGIEYEVFGHSFQMHNKTQNLIAEKVGRTTIDVPMRNQNEQNVWEFRLAKHPNEEFDDSALDRRPTGKELLSKIRTYLLKKGAFGIRGITKVFRSMTKPGQKEIDIDDFKWGLRNAGVFFNDEDLKSIILELDQNNSGTIDFIEFLSFIRGQINKHRLGLISRAYEKLNSDLDGNVTLEAISKVFNAERHPDVLKQFKTVEEVFKEFLFNWDTKNRDGIISYEEFEEYYKDICSTIEKDEQFEMIIRNVWNLSS